MVSDKIIQNNEIDIKIIINILIKNKMSIFLFSFLFSLIGIYYSLSLPNLYQSTLSIYSNVSNNAASELDQIKGVINSFGFSNLEQGNTVTISDIINSRTFGEKLIYKEWDNNKFNTAKNLIIFWEINKKGNSQLFNPMVWIRSLINLPRKFINKFNNLSSSQKNGENIQDEWKIDALNKLSKRININKTSTGLYNISILMEEPQLASDIANYIYKLLTNYYANNYLESAHRNRVFIEERQTEILIKLEVAENNLKIFRERNRSLSASPQLQLEEGRLQRDVILQSKVFIILSEQLELAKIKELDNQPTIDVLDKAIPSIEKNQPSRTRIVLISMIIGLGLGSLFVISKSILFND